MAYQQSDQRFNLIEEGWLPLRRRSGTTDWVPPAAITAGVDSADPYVALDWPRPDFNGAAHELLIGLLATTCAPADEQEWLQWWRSPPSPAVLAERFATVADAFELMGDGPRFGQDPAAMSDVAPRPVEQLLINAPGANTKKRNADMFVRGDATPAMSRGSAAMALFTLQAYAPVGGQGHRTSLRGGGPLTTLVVAGETLWSRLWANVESAACRQRRAKLYADAAEGTVFPWTAPTRGSAERSGGGPTVAADIHALQVYWGTPRRIRLKFEPAGDARCGITGGSDGVLVRQYRTAPNGANYIGDFAHPLTPSYTGQGAAGRLPVHGHPGAVTYRLWPSVLVGSADGRSRPAPMVGHWLDVRAAVAGVAPQDTRIVAYGYAMAKSSAEAWVEGEMPVWRHAPETRAVGQEFIRGAVGAADVVAHAVVWGVKASRYDKPKDARGNTDYELIRERFYRDTEAPFFAALDTQIGMADLSHAVLSDWLQTMRRRALALFDEYVPLFDAAAPHPRQVRARASLDSSLKGYGKQGRQLFGLLHMEAPKQRTPEGAEAA